MFSFLKRTPSPERVQAELGKIAVIMARLESYGFRSLAEIADQLNKDFFLGIPSAEREVDGRVFLFPNGSSLGLSLLCGDPFNPGKVSGYTLIGYEEISNCLVHGNTGDQGESFTWSIGIESSARDLPPLSKALHEAFWQLPGYQTLGVAEYRFLLRRMA